MDSSLIRPSCVINYTVRLFFFFFFTPRGLRMMFTGGKINRSKKRGMGRCEGEDIKSRGKRRYSEARKGLERVSEEVWEQG